MIPLYETDGKGWTFLGLPMSQNRLAVPIWSYCFEKYPPATIIEIGTNCGGFTTFLGIQALMNGGQVHTFDTGEEPNDFGLWDSCPIIFYRSDCFAVVTLINKLIERRGRTYILCDGGDKRREFSYFCDAMKPGDVIAAHDYCVNEEWWPWGEIEPKDVAQDVKQNNLKPFMQQHLDMAGWLAYQKE